jgi:hypothetical protein
MGRLVAQPMSVLFASATIDQLEASRGWLTAIAVMVSATVWLGVFLEKDSFPEWVKRRGWKLLVYALFAETVLGAMLWEVDTRITTKQAEIIAGRMVRLVQPDQQRLIVSLLSPIPKGKVLIDAALDGEAWQFADSISATLKESGFDVADVPFGDRFSESAAKAIRTGMQPTPDSPKQHARASNRQDKTDMVQARWGFESLRARR